MERLKDLYRRRRDVMLQALQEHFGGRGELDAAPGRAVHLGDARRRRHHRPAGAQRGRGVRAGARRLRGRPQRRLLDALNFAGVPDEEIREGIRRIGRTLGPDTGLLGTLTGTTARQRHAGGTGEKSGRARRARIRCTEPGARGRARAAAQARSGPSARAGSMSRTCSSGTRSRRRRGHSSGRGRGRQQRGLDERRARRSRCSRAEARWSARCRCARARRRRGAGRLGHEVVAIDAGPELVAQLRDCRARRGVHRAARPRRRGRDRAGAAGGDRHPLHGLGARRPACAAPTRRWRST